LQLGRLPEEEADVIMGEVDVDNQQYITYLEVYRLSLIISFLHASLLAFIIFIRNKNWKKEWVCYSNAGKH